jgi:hypothetical protein
VPHDQLPDDIDVLQLPLTLFDQVSTDHAIALVNQHETVIGLGE